MLNVQRQSDYIAVIKRLNQGAQSRPTDNNLDKSHVFQLVQIILHYYNIIVTPSGSNKKNESIRDLCSSLVGRCMKTFRTDLRPPSHVRFVFKTHPNELSSTSRVASNAK